VLFCHRFLEESNQISGVSVLGKVTQELCSEDDVAWVFKIQCRSAFCVPSVCNRAARQCTLPCYSTVW